jgi:hypothetical protein
VVKEISGGFVRLEEKATEALRRLEEHPGFPKLEYAEWKRRHTVLRGEPSPARAQWASTL